MIDRERRVAILIYSLGSGGAERVASILINRLYKEFHITLFLMNDTIAYSIPDEVKIEYLENSRPFESGVKKLFKLPILGWKYRNRVKGNFDISLSLMNRPNYINIFSRLFGSEVKTVISERGNPSTHYKNSLIGRTLVKFLYPKADLVTSNSYGNRVDLQKNFSVSDIKVIQNPIDVEDIEISQGGNGKDFITIGRVDNGKNHKLQIDALSGIDDNWSLTIIGDGLLKDELESYVESLKLSHKVKFLGRRENPFEYLKKADFFLFSSNHEGFPNVLLEALASGLPIVSTDCKSGPREILAPDTPIGRELSDIEVAEYGILSPVGDVESFRKGITAILKSSETVNRLKVNSRKRAEEFSTDKIIGEFRELLNL